MPATLLRYIRGQILLASSFVLIAFLALFTFFDFLAEIDQLLRPGVKISHILTNILLGLPARVYELAPLAALIGAVYTLAALASSSQFTVMRSAGLNMRTALAIMLRTGLVIVVITVLVGEIVTPMAERVAAAGAESGQTGTGRLKSGLWIRDSLFRDGALHRVRFVNFQSYVEGQGLEGVNVYEFSSNHRMTSWIQAEQARYDTDGVWTLIGVRERVFEVASGGEPDRLNDTRLDSLRWESSLNPDVLSGLYTKPDRMSALQLWRYQNFLEDNRQNADSVKLALAKKLVYPLAILVMMVIALPFAYLQVRSGGVSFKIFLGIMLGIGFYLLNNLFSHLNAVANLPPFVSASVPSLLALSGGLIGLWWVNRV